MDQAASRRAVVDRWRRRRRRPRWWLGVTMLGVLALFVGLAGIVSHYRAPQSIVTLAISATSPYLVVGTLAAIALFAVSRGISGWIGLLASVLVLAWYVAIQAPLFTATAVPSTGHDVIVMTSNLKLGSADPASLVAAVGNHGAELLMLEELTPDEQVALDSVGLDRLLPYHVSDPRPGAEGTGLWSRYPISDTEVRYDFGFSFITARVHLPELTQSPTVVALHMFGPYPRSLPWLRDINHLPAVLQGLPSSAPVVVGGDFNATPDVVQFRRLLRGGYADAADQSGAGFTPTYPADRFFPPVLAIDHVLTRGGMGHRADTLHIPGSDHRALVVTVRLPG